MPGYPWQGQFQTRAEVEAYFGTEKLCCLMCGKFYKSVGSHLRLHDMTIPEYKERFGLAKFKGLVCEDTSDLHSIAVKQRIAEGWAPPGNADMMQAMRAANKHHKPPYVLNESGARMSNNSKVRSMLGLIGYKNELFESFLARVAEGRSVRSVCSDPDMPEKSCVGNRRRTNRSFRERLDLLVDLLPIKVQAKSESLGMHFRLQVQALRDEGLTYAAIADRLGVATMTVWRHMGTERNRRK